MEALEVSTIKQLYQNQKELTLFGKWITLNDILPLFKKHEKKFTIRTLGTSEQHRAIYSFTIGNGPKKILLWSQMHGMKVREQEPYLIFSIALQTVMKPLFKQ